MGLPIAPINAFLSCVCVTLLKVVLSLPAAPPTPGFAYSAAAQALLATAFVASWLLIAAALEALFPQAGFGKSLSRKWQNAERVNGALHSTLVVVLSSWAIVAAVGADPEGRIHYDAANSAAPPVELSLAVSIGYAELVLVLLMLLLVLLLIKCF